MIDMNIRAYLGLFLILCGIVVWAIPRPKTRGGAGFMIIKYMIQPDTTETVTIGSSGAHVSPKPREGE